MIRNEHNGDVFCVTTLLFGFGFGECPPWCSIVCVTVTVHQFCCILHACLWCRGFCHKTESDLFFHERNHRSILTIREAH